MREVTEHLEDSSSQSAKARNSLNTTSKGSKSREKAQNDSLLSIVRSVESLQFAVSELTSEVSRELRRLNLLITTAHPNVARDRMLEDRRKLALEYADREEQRMQRRRDKLIQHRRDLANERIERDAKKK